MITASGASAEELTELERLRAANYNATLAAVVQVHRDLRILRVVPDSGIPSFEAGQFLTLGLGNWEPRVTGAEEEHLDAMHYRRLAKRAYSISCSVLDAEGVLRRAGDFPYLEFYIALVRHTGRSPPSLTPRIFALRPGDRLFVECKPVGNYSLRGVRAENDVFFFATGTGEAPHNAMIAELLVRGHAGRVVSAVSVRYGRDAAYRTCHEELASRCPNYRYLVLATRELPRTADSPGAHSRKRHLQDLLGTGELERVISTPLDPDRSQVFLCGNPAMIGARHSSPGKSARPAPGSMLDALIRRGFRVARGGHAGNLHFEQYW